MEQVKSIVKKENVIGKGTAEQLLGLTESLCENLPQAIEAGSETASACAMAKMGEVSVILQRMASAKPEEMPALIEQNKAAYKALNRKDIQNKIYGLAITAIVCGGIVRIVKYACKAARLVA